MNCFSRRRKSGVTLAEALVMILVAGSLMVPVIGTLQQTVSKTNSLELRTAMQNFAESKMAEISYQSIYEGIKPVNETASLDYPNSTDPDYFFDLQVEVVPGASIEGEDGVIDGPQHADLCAISITVGLRNSGQDMIPDVATISMLTMACPPPPPPDMIFVGHPDTRKIAVINPMNHELITEYPLGTILPIQIAVHPSGKWIAIKATHKIAMMDVTTGAVIDIYSSSDICSAGTAETGTGDNQARQDRGMAFRSDGKYLYFTKHADKKLYVLTSPTNPFSAWSLQGSYGLVNLSNDVSNDLKILEDGTLVVAQGASTLNKVFRFDTHTNTVINTFAGGANTTNALQLAFASEWGGNNLFARLGGNKMTSFSADSPTNFLTGTIGGDFDVGDTSQHSILLSNDNRWLIMSDAVSGGASSQRLAAFKLPISNTNLQTNTISRQVTRGPSAGAGEWNITQLEYSPYREELIAKTSDNQLLFPSIDALTGGSYGNVNDIDPAILALTSGASDVKGRIAEYVWVACSDNSSVHKIECLDLYGGNDTNGIILADNAVTLTAKPNSLAMNAAGNEAVVSYNTVGVNPKKVKCSNYSIEEFPNALAFVPDGIASKTIFLRDGSLLALTSKLICGSSHEAGDFFPGGGLAATAMHNGFLLYDIDDSDGHPNSAACLGFTAPGDSSGFRARDAVAMHKTDGAYVLMSKADQTDGILLWIEKSKAAGYTPAVATDSYRIMGYWRNSYDGFPSKSAIKMALSADDTMLAFYSNDGTGTKQTISFFDLNNSHFPTTAGLAYNRYKQPAYNPANGDEISNSYYNYPLSSNYPATANDPILPGNTLTASTSLRTDVNFDPDNPTSWETDVSNSDDTFYGFSGYFYHKNANYVGFKSHDGARFGRNGYYPYRHSQTREPWVEGSGDEYFSYVFEATTGFTQIQIDYFSNDGGMGAVFAKSAADGNFTSGNWGNVVKPRAQDFRPFRFRPPLIKKLVLDGSGGLPDLPSSNADEILMTFSRDSAIPALFILDKNHEYLQAYNPFIESLNLYNGSDNPFYIDLTGMSGITSYNDMAVSPDGRRLLLTTTESTAGAIYTMKIDYDPTTPGKIILAGSAPLDHTLFSKKATEKPALHIATRPFNSFNSGRNTYPATTNTGASLVHGYGSHRAGVADGGIFLFGGAPGVVSEPNSNKIQKIDARAFISDESAVLNEMLKDFAVVPFDSKLLLFGGLAPSDEPRTSVSVYDPATQKFQSAYFAAMKNDANDESNELHRHSAVATPFGPMIMGGVKGALGTDEIVMNSNWDNFPLSKNLGAGCGVDAPEMEIAEGNGSDAVGSFYLANPIPITADTSFYTSFRTRIDGKDGVTFCVQNDSATAVGDGTNGCGYRTIPNSIAVWIDTKGDNNGLGGWSADDNFVAIVAGGDDPDDDSARFLGSANHFWVYPGHGLGGQVDTEVITYWWVIYDGQRDKINVWSSSTNDPETANWAIKDFPLDLLTEVGGAGSSAWFGFTSATNDSNADIDIQDWTLKVWEKDAYAAPLYDDAYQAYGSPPWAGIDRLGTTLPTQGNSMILVGDNTSSVRGAVWRTNPVNLDTLDSFRCSFALAMWSGGGSGISFIIQNEADGSSKYPSTIEGSAIAYGGFSNSVVVEFDTTDSGTFDPDDNHVGIVKNGNYNVTPKRHKDPGWDMNLDSNRMNFFWVEYDAPSRNLRVYGVGQDKADPLPSQPITPFLNHIFSSSLDTMVSGNQIWLGFGASCGSSSLQEHYVASWKYEQSNSDASSGAITDEVKLYNPNTISGMTGEVSSQLSLAGVATIESDYLKLHPPSAGVKGAIWVTEPVTVVSTSSFSTHYVVQFTESASPPADGMTFIVQGNGNSALTSVAGIGVGYEGIANSIGVELDLWFNTGDVSGNDIAINSGGVANTELAHTDSHGIANLADGKDKHIWVDYDGNTKVMKVYISNTPVKPGTHQLTYTFGSTLTTLLGGTSAWFGFGSATGSNYTNPRIKHWELIVDNNKIIRFPTQGETLAATSLPDPMINGTAVTHYSRKDKKYHMYYVGPGSALGTQFPEMIYKYDFDTGIWTPKPLWHASNKVNVNFSQGNSASMVNQRTQVAACSWGDEIFIFSGHYTTTNSNTPMSIAYNPDTNTYRELTGVPAASNNASAIPYGPYIYLIGGSPTPEGSTGTTHNITRYKP